MGSGHEGTRRSGKGGEPNGVELSSHSSDGTRHAALALVRSRACAHVKAGGGEVTPVGEGLIPLRGRWETHVDARRAKAIEEFKGVTRREIGYVGFGFYILEVHARLQAAIEHVEHASDTCEVRLTRVAFDKGGERTGVVDPVQDVASPKEVGEGEVGRDAGDELARTYLLLTGDKQVV